MRITRPVVSARDEVDEEPCPHPHGGPPHLSKSFAVTRASVRKRTFGAALYPALHSCLSRAVIYPSSRAGLHHHPRIPHLFFGTLDFYQMSAASPSMDHSLDDKVKQDAAFVDNQSVSSVLDDDRLLQEIGYVPSFKREFSNLATVRHILLHSGTCPRCFSSGVIGVRMLNRQFVSTDQLRVQHHGPVLQHSHDLQHPAAARRACIGDMVLDPGCLHVLHARCVPKSSTRFARRT